MGVEALAHWHEVHNTDPGDNLLDDPLVSYSYITSYPANPFVNDGMIVIRSTTLASTPAQGDGDPRFGYKGKYHGKRARGFLLLRASPGWTSRRMDQRNENRRTLPRTSRRLSDFRSSRNGVPGTSLHVRRTKAMGHALRWLKEMKTLMTDSPGIPCIAASGITRRSAADTRITIRDIAVRDISSATSWARMDRFATVGHDVTACRIKRLTVRDSVSDAGAVAESSGHEFRLRADSMRLAAVGR